MTTAFTTKAFLDVYNNELVPELPFNKAWANGTGYFDGAVRGPDAVMLAPGKTAKAYTGDGNDRKILFVGTAFGVIAIFQRYTHGDDDVFTINAAPKLSRVLTPVLSRPLTYENMVFLIGNGFGFDREDGRENVATWLANVIASTAEK